MGFLDSHLPWLVREARVPRADRRSVGGLILLPDNVLCIPEMRVDFSAAWGGE